MLRLRSTMAIGSDRSTRYIRKMYSRLGAGINAHYEYMRHRRRFEADFRTATRERHVALPEQQVVHRLHHRDQRRGARGVHADRRSGEAQAVRQVRTLYTNNGSLSAQVTLRPPYDPTNARIKS